MVWLFQTIKKGDTGNLGGRRYPLEVGVQAFCMIQKDLLALWHYTWLLCLTNLKKPLLAGYFPWVSLITIPVSKFLKGE